MTVLKNVDVYNKRRHEGEIATSTIMKDNVDQ